eukprot:TRINITY_DN2897_c0_g1_i4.p1 TRINITY_DN2897_c0_g1~~TRINITY_DN2897_c0_g1_i4.p1  ORF type:complete len:613 (+),score=108.33 TRINITY_DN2897_c0_g1_i4:66-1904(+)
MRFIVKRRAGKMVVPAAKLTIEETKELVEKYGEKVGGVLRDKVENMKGMELYPLQTAGHVVLSLASLRWVCERAVISIQKEFMLNAPCLSPGEVMQAVMLHNLSETSPLPLFEHKDIDVKSQCPKKLFSLLLQNPTVTHDARIVTRMAKKILALPKGVSIITSHHSFHPAKSIIKILRKTLSPSSPLVHYLWLFQRDPESIELLTSSIPPIKNLNACEGLLLRVVWTHTRSIPACFSAVMQDSSAIQPRGAAYLVNLLGQKCPVPRNVVHCALKSLLKGFDDLEMSEVVWLLDGLYAAYNMHQSLASTVFDMVCSTVVESDSASFHNPLHVAKVLSFTSGYIVRKQHLPRLATKALVRALELVGIPDRIKDLLRYIHCCTRLGKEHKDFIEARLHRLVMTFESLDSACFEVARFMNSLGELDTKMAGVQGMLDKTMSRLEGGESLDHNHIVFLVWGTVKVLPPGKGKKLESKLCKLMIQCPDFFKKLKTTQLMKILWSVSLMEEGLNYREIGFKIEERVLAEDLTTFTPSNVESIRSSFSRLKIKPTQLEMALRDTTPKHVPPTQPVLKSPTLLDEMVDEWVGKSTAAAAAKSKATKLSNVVKPETVKTTFF